MEDQLRVASGQAGIVAVLGDEAIWGARGILIAMVEAGDTDGVRVGVHTDPHAAQVTLGAYYPFPVVCYQWPDNWL